MILASFAALRQTNIKRLLSYSSIGNMGYMLVAISIGSKVAITSGIIYLIIYMVASIGIFALVNSIHKEDEDLENISDFTGLSKSNPYYAFALAVLMFSVAGIPPMAGFFGKFFVFKEAMASGFYLLSVIGVLTSVVACFYYLKIVKIMYFDENTGGKILPQSLGVKCIIAVSLIFTLGLIFKTSLLIDIASSAVSSLF
jgi:NADH-quinone oxidoreductase subunit N